MGDNNDPNKRTGVNFSAENYAFASASGNITQFVNSVLDRLRTGQMVDTEAIAKGDAKFNCMFHLAPLDGKDIRCPVRVEHPEVFCGDKNTGNLLQACGKCVLMYEHKKLVDLRLRYPSAFKEDVESLPTTQTVKEQIESKQVLASVPPPKKTRYEEVTAKRLFCSDCRASFASYMEDDAAADRLVETFENHLKVMHGSRPMTEHEVNQFGRIRGQQP